MATGILTARVLGPEGKGEFALLLIVVAVVFAFGRLGISQAVVYFAKRIPPAALTANALTLSAAIGLVSLVVGGGVAYVVAPGFYDLSRPTLAVALLSVPLLSIEGTAAGIIQGDYAMKKLNVLRILNPLAFLPLLLVGLLFPDRVEAAIFATVGAQALSTAAAVGVAIRGKGISATAWKPEWSRWAALLRFGVQTHVGNVLKFFQFRFDVVLIGALLETRQVGFYVVALSLAELPLRIPDAVGLVLFPRVAAMAGEKGERRDITPLVCRHTILLTSVASVALFAITPWLVTHAFGSRFEDAVVPARLLLPGGIALSLWKILAQDVIAKGRPNAFSFSACCSLVAMVAGCSLLIPRFGLAGGAIASSAAYVTASVVLYVAYRRTTGQRLRDCVLIRREDLQLYWRALVRLKGAVAVRSS